MKTPPLVSEKSESTQETHGKTEKPCKAENAGVLQRKGERGASQAIAKGALR